MRFVNKCFVSFAVPLPPNIVQVQVNPCSVSAVINAQQDDFSLKEILLQGPGDNEPRVIDALLPGQDSTFEFIGLQPSTQYKIGARTTVGYGDFAEKSEDEITEIITCKLSTCRK